MDSGDSRRPLVTMWSIDGMEDGSWELSAAATSAVQGIWVAHTRVEKWLDSGSVWNMMAQY